MAPRTHELPTAAEMLASYHHALGSLDAIAKIAAGATVRSLYLPVLATLAGALGFFPKLSRDGETLDVLDEEEDLIAQLDVSTPDEGDDEPDFGQFVFDLMTDMNTLLARASGRRAGIDRATLLDGTEA